MKRQLTDVKQLEKGESLVEEKSTGKIGRVIGIIMAENLFTVRFFTDEKTKGFCDPKDFYLVIPNVPGTVPRGSL